MFPYYLTPKALEIKQIRRAANCIGAAYAFIFFPNLLLEYLAMNSSGFAAFIRSVSHDAVFSAILDIFFAVLVFIPPFLMAAAMGGRSFAVADFRKPKKGKILPLVLIGFGICQIGEITTFLFGSQMAFFGSEPIMSEPVYERSLYGVLAAVASTAIVPALCEEFALRGVTMGMIRRHGDDFAIFVSALLFGLMHRNLVQTPFAFIVGLGLGFIAIKGGSVFVAVLVHFLNNITSVAFEYIEPGLSYTMQSVLYSCYGMVVLGLGILGFLLYKDKKELFTLERAEENLSFGRKMGVFFSSPIIIIVLCLTAIEIFKIQIG